MTSYNITVRRGFSDKTRVWKVRADTSKQARDRYARAIAVMGWAETIMRVERCDAAHDGGENGD